MFRFIYISYRLQLVQKNTPLIWNPPLYICDSRKLRRGKWFILSAEGVFFAWPWFIIPHLLERLFKMASDVPPRPVCILVTQGDGGGALNRCQSVSVISQEPVLNWVFFSPKYTLAHIRVRNLFTRMRHFVF